LPGTTALSVRPEEEWLFALVRGRAADPQALARLPIVTSPRGCGSGLGNPPSELDLMRSPGA
jgi:hypothetical protein